MKENIAIESAMFCEARQLFNEVLKGTLKAMSSKKLMSGSVIMKVSIEMTNEEGADPETGVMEIVAVPEFKCKVSSKVGHSGSFDAKIHCDGYLYKDEDGQLLLYNPQMSLEDLT